MKRMFIFLFTAAITTICGCMQNFTGSVKINKTDGTVTSVEVKLPSSYILHDRNTTSRLIEQLESTLADLKTARDLMPVDERRSATSPQEK